MFTGLVEAVGRVVEREPHERRLPAADRDRRWRRELAPGDSLAVNGVCLTVTIVEAGEIHADVGPETLRVTTLGRLRPGSR